MIILNGYLYMYVNLIVCMYDHPSFCMCDTLQKNNHQSKENEEVKSERKITKGVSNQLCLL